MLGIGGISFDSALCRLGVYMHSEGQEGGTLAVFIQSNKEDWKSCPSSPLGSTSSYFVYLVILVSFL